MLLRSKHEHHHPAAASYHTAAVTFSPCIPGIYVLSNDDGCVKTGHLTPKNNQELLCQMYEHDVSVRLDVARSPGPLATDAAACL